MLVWSRTQSERVFVHTEEPSGVGTASGNWLQQKFSTLYRLKSHTRLVHNACFPFVTAYTQEMLIFHCPWFTPTQYLLFVSHVFHLRNACFSFGMAYPNARLVLHWPQPTPAHSFFPVIILLILSTTRCVYQQQPPSWSQVKVMKLYITVYNLLYITVYQLL